MTSGSIYKVCTGQLIIDLVDTNAKLYLWCGTATDGVNSDASKTEKEVAKALTKMFEKSPQPTN